MLAGSAGLQPGEETVIPEGADAFVAERGHHAPSRTRLRAGDRLRRGGLPRRRGPWLPSPRRGRYTARRSRDDRHHGGRRLRARRTARGGVRADRVPSVTQFDALKSLGFESWARGSSGASTNCSRPATRRPCGLGAPGAARRCSWTPPRSDASDGSSSRPPDFRPPAGSVRSFRGGAGRHAARQTSPVTGGNRGIGLEVVHQLRDLGLQVFLGDAIPMQAPRPRRRSAPKGSCPSASTSPTPPV